MIEKSAVVGQFFPKKTQRSKNAFKSFIVGDEAALGPDTKGCQSEAGSGDAGGCRLARVVDIASVFDEPGVRAALLPEEKAAGALDVVEELIVFGSQSGSGRDHWAASSGNWTGGRNLRKE